MAIGRAMGSSTLVVLGASAGSRPVLPVARPAELLPQPLCSAVPASSSAPIPAWANRFISSPIAWGKCADDAHNVNPRTRMRRKLWKNAAEARPERQNQVQCASVPGFVGELHSALLAPLRGCGGVTNSSPLRASTV